MIHSASTAIELFAKRFLDLILKHFTGRIAAGALILASPFVVYYIIKWAFNIADDIFKPILPLIPFLKDIPDISGLGFALLIVAMYILGVITMHALGKKVVLFFPNLLRHIPVIGPIYDFAEQMSNMIRGQENGRHEERLYKVIAYQEEIKGGTKTTYGLYMNDIIQQGEDCVNFYYPTSPTPNSGFIWIMPRRALFAVLLPNDKPLQVPKLMAYTISCGIVSPEETKLKPLLDI